MAFAAPLARDTGPAQPPGVLLSRWTQRDRCFCVLLDAPPDLGTRPAPGPRPSQGAEGDLSSMEGSALGDLKRKIRWIEDSDTVDLSITLTDTEHAVLLRCTPKGQVTFPLGGSGGSADCCCQHCCLYCYPNWAADTCRALTTGQAHPWSST